MTVYYKIKASEELFERWSDLPSMIEHEQFQEIVQNDIEITNNQLVEWMNRVHAAEKQFAEELHKLFIDTIKYIKKKEWIAGIGPLEKPKRPTGRYIKEKDLKKGRDAIKEDEND